MGLRLADIRGQTVKLIYFDMGVVAKEVLYNFVVRWRSVHGSVMRATVESDEACALLNLGSEQAAGRSVDVRRNNTLVIDAQVRSKPQIRSAQTVHRTNGYASG